MDESEAIVMFRFEFFVEDKNVTTVLRDIAGIGLDVKCVPVLNAEKKPRVQEKVKNADGLQIFISHLKRLPSFNKTDTIDALRNMGLAPGSHSYYIKQALKRGLIVRTKAGIGRMPSIYKVVE
jgi:hypothetical protein